MRAAFQTSVCPASNYRPSNSSIEFSREMTCMDVVEMANCSDGVLWHFRYWVLIEIHAFGIF